MDIFYPIQLFANAITSNPALNFFIYDIIKITLLLLIVNFCMAASRYYLPVDKVKNLLSSRNWFGLDYLLAALLGVATPFCSCSSIPLFIGFLGAGIPLGVTFSFLIASPLVNESSLIMFPALFGLRITIIYNLIGIFVAVVGGSIIQALNLDRFVNRSLLKTKSRHQIEADNGGRLSSFQLISLWWSEGLKITKSIILFVIIGVGLGALIHGFLPVAVVEKYLSSRSWWAVPLATLFGVPLYANSVTVIPIVQALIGKGVPLGTALAFMTAAVTLSIPEAFMLLKAMKWQLLAVFFGITTLGIITIGYIFNAIG